MPEPINPEFAIAEFFKAAGFLGAVYSQFDEPGNEDFIAVAGGVGVAYENKDFSALPQIEEIASKPDFLETLTTDKDRKKDLATTLFQVVKNYSEGKLDEAVVLIDAYHNRMEADLPAVFAEIGLPDVDPKTFIANLQQSITANARQ